MGVALLLLASASVLAATAASHHGPQSLNGYSTDIECYERVAVGKKLNDSEVGTSLSINTVRRCEQECERAKCYAFSFGISHSGNGTCQLATKMPSSDTTINDIEYDLFYKNMACINRISVGLMSKPEPALSPYLGLQSTGKETSLRAYYN